MTFEIDHDKLTVGLDEYAAAVKKSLQPEGASESTSALAGTHRIAWGGGIIGIPGGMGLVGEIRTLFDGKTSTFYGGVLGVALTLCGGGGLGEIYIDVAELKETRTFARVVLTPPWPHLIPPILPMMWVDLWEGNRRVGWFGGAVGGVTFGGWGEGYLRWA